MRLRLKVRVVYVFEVRRRVKERLRGRGRGRVEGHLLLLEREVHRAAKQLRDQGVLGHRHRQLALVDLPRSGLALG